MSKFNVKIKWTNERQTLENVELCIDEAPLVFKAQLFALTGVPTDRQKLMFKGSVIKDDAWPENMKVSDGCMFMLMGSNEKLPEDPVVKPKFVEDMSEHELATALDMPSGLTNLGNTCYMSATVQCLKTVPALREALRRYQGQLSVASALALDAGSENVTASLRDLYTSMDRSSSVEPVILLSVLQSAIPRFAQKAEGGVYQQQDANECWTELTRMLQQSLKPLNQDSKHNNFIDEYFGGTFEVEMKCDEAPEEPPTVSNENFLQLSCFISQDIKYMQSGLISRMKETLTKSSPTLGRDASYTKTSRISRLPAYLTVQFVRFFYKGNVQTNAKMLRDVKFSMNLDVYELCTPALQEKLAPMRQKYKEADDHIATTKAGMVRPDGEESGATTSAGSNSTGTSSGKDTDSKDPEENLKLVSQYSFVDDPGSNNSGFYELKAVLTHKGRSSSSGHYVAWIRRGKQWFQCDDDRVEAVDEEEILKLSGGGDWHCAYVLLYGPKLIPTFNNDNIGSVATDTTVSPES